MQALSGLLQNIEADIKSNSTEYEGSDYIKEPIHKVFKDKEIKVYKDSERADTRNIGSQRALYVSCQLWNK
ncbi:MAG: hypothetical protein R2809_10000 [Flavobacteriales bacterium]